MDVLNPYRAGTGMSEGERVSTGPVDFVGVLSEGQLFRRNLQSAGSIGRAVPLICVFVVVVDKLSLLPASVVRW